MKKRHEKYLFQENKNGYLYILLFLAFNTAYTIMALNNMAVNKNIGVTTIFNIFLSLVGFLTAVKTKRYYIKWAYFSLILGALQFIRIFDIPSVNKTNTKFMLIALLVVSGVFALLGGYISVNKCKIRTRLLSNNTKTE